MNECQYLLNDKIKNNILTKIKNTKLLLMFLDYDGTLAPFATDPARAFPLPKIKEQLQKLSQNQNVFLSIITGRKISDLKKLINIENINYAGIHGLEIEINNSRNNFEEENKFVNGLESLKNYLKTNYCSRKNFKLEDKKYVLTLHHPQNINTTNIIKNISQQINKEKFEIMAGRQIIEVKPVGWDKGKAVKKIKKHILQTINKEKPQHLNIYIGDDTTDEDAFSVLDSENDLSIYVKNEDNIETKAKYYLNNPEEVLQFLILCNSIPH